MAKPSAQEMARRFRIRDEARLDRLAEDARREWREDQRDQEFDREYHRGE